MKFFIQFMVSMVFLFVTCQVVSASPEQGKLTQEPSTMPPPRLKRTSQAVEKYKAIESMSLRIGLDSSLHGFVEGKLCDHCKKIRVTITPQTKAYSNNIEVPLKQAESRLGRYATVIYEVKTKKVTAIRW